MSKQSAAHILPFNRTPYKIDYESIAKQIVLKYIDTSSFKISIFGSRARQTHHRFSDLDIGIIGSNPLPATIQLDMEHELNQSRIPYKVEVVDFTQVDEVFKNEAMKNIVWWN